MPAPETQEPLHRQAIRLKKTGHRYREITMIIGFHRNPVFHWRKVYKRAGATGLKSKKRGFEKGQWRTFDSAQEQEIQGLIVETTPDQLKLVFALWIR